VVHGGSSNRAEGVDASAADAADAPGMTTCTKRTVRLMLVASVCAARTS
jgi:hypothetical protein